MRPLNQDMMQSMRFHVNIQVGGESILSKGVAQAGFSACSTPELTIEATEYKEGLDVYVQKYPGGPTVSDVSLSRGVTYRDTSFYDWVRLVAEGGGSYRADSCEIYHFHRVGFLNQTYPNPTSTFSRVKEDTVEPARVYTLHNAFPTRCKVAGDLDATSNEVSVAEVDLAYESFDVTTPEVQGLLGRG